MTNGIASFDVLPFHNRAIFAGDVQVEDRPACPLKAIPIQVKYNEAPLVACDHAICDGAGISRLVAKMRPLGVMKG